MFIHRPDPIHQVRVETPDPVFAEKLLEQFGGATGELSAAITYFTQSFHCEDQGIRDMLQNIATEEFSHLEMVALMIEHDELDLDGKGRSFRTVPAESRAELVAMLDKALADSRRAREGTTEEHLMKPWRLKMGEQVLSEGPRYVTIGDGGSAEVVDEHQAVFRLRCCIEHLDQRCVLGADRRCASHDCSAMRSATTIRSTRAAARRRSTIRRPAR